MAAAARCKELHAHTLVHWDVIQMLHIVSSASHTRWYTGQKIMYALERALLDLTQ